MNYFHGLRSVFSSFDLKIKYVIRLLISGLRLYHFLHFIEVKSFWPFWLRGIRGEEEGKYGGKDHSGASIIGKNDK